MNTDPQQWDFTCVFLSSYLWENYVQNFSFFYTIKYFLFSVSCTSRILLHFILHKSSLFSPRRVNGKSYQTKTCIFLNKGVSVSTLIISPRIGRFKKVLYSTLLHLPPLRFHCVRGCLNWTQSTNLNNFMAISIPCPRVNSSRWFNPTE